MHLGDGCLDAAGAVGAAFDASMWNFGVALLANSEHGAGFGGQES
jgi:hypothetical protein